MTDDLKHLKDMMTAATPKPAQKADDLALAMKNFDDLQNSRQGSVDEPRLTSDRPTNRSGFTAGVFSMLNSLTTRGTLTVTTSIAALGIGLFFYTQNDLSGFSSNPDQSPEIVKDTALTLPNPAPAKPPAAPTVVAQSGASNTASSNPTLGKIAESGATSGDLMRETSTEVFAAESPMLMAEPAPVTASRKMAPQAATGLSREIAAYDDSMIAPEVPNTEAFANEDSNPVKITSDDPVSTFSIDVDTASYAIMRSSILNGYLPDPQSVRVEEMINYFPYDYPAPMANEAPFKPTITIMPTPWNAGTQLVHIGIQGEMPALDDRPPLNLVFLIDTSGSMNSRDKLPLLIQSFNLMLSQLRPEDEIAIVTYAGSAGMVLEPTKVSDKSRISAALSHLSAGGSTAGQQGLQQAYSVVESMAKDGEIGRIILATDGDFNVGISNPDALKDFIAKKRDTGTYLSVLGFGRGNLDDATMQALAQNGNGQAAYIDTLSEAQKVLVDQLGGALFPIANDVKIQVEFNPTQIAEYRLIGYETRALAREDFNNDAVDAGEIGAGHTVTAIYEITPVGSDAVLNDALRYQTTDAIEGSKELGFLKLRYKTPGADTSQLLSTPITADMNNITDDVKFSVAIAGYGQILRDSKYLNGWSFDDAIAFAVASKGDDAFGYRAEAIKLMRLAKSLDAN